MKYFLYAHTTDMRKGFRGLSGLVRNELKRDPADGSVYIFINRRRDKIKLLVWDRNGFVLYYKSLESGTFEFPRNHWLLRFDLCQIVPGSPNFLKDQATVTWRQKRKDRTNTLILWVSCRNTRHTRGPLCGIQEKPTHNQHIWFLPTQKPTQKNQKSCFLPTL